jgi:rhodanese-related sulfurtransferase
VAQQLQKLGIDAAALDGGFDAWRSQFAVEPVAAAA